MLFISIANETFLFSNMSIKQITQRICKYVDEGILQPEDLEKFINEFYQNHNKSEYIELYNSFEKP